MFISDIGIKAGVFGRRQRVGRGAVGGFLSGFKSGFGIVEFITFSLNGVLYHKKSQGHIDENLKN